MIAKTFLLLSIFCAIILWALCANSSKMSRIEEERQRYIDKQ